MNPLLKDTEVDTQWIIGVLSDFNVVWDSMTLENRGRLIRAFVGRVDVDEPNERIVVTFRDIGKSGESGIEDAAKEAVI